MQMSQSYNKGLADEHTRRKTQHSHTIGFRKFRCESIRTPLFSDDVLMAENNNIKVFWDVKSCSLVHDSNVLTGRAASFLGPAAGSSGTFVPIYQAV